MITYQYKLKACPVCGMYNGIGEMPNVYTSKPSRIGGFIFEIACIARGPIPHQVRIYGEGGTEEEAEADAVKNWNTRTYPPGMNHEGQD